MSVETPVNMVKGSKSKGKQQYRPNAAKEGTPPLNDVRVFSKQLNDWVVIPGISEEQKIAEGSMQPLAFGSRDLENVNDEKGNFVRLRGRFEKSEADREALAKVKHVQRRAPFQTKPFVEPKGEPTGTLIVHLANFRRKRDYKNFKLIKEGETKADPRPSGFKTTYSFNDVTNSDINDLIRGIVRLNPNDPNDKPLNYVLKYYFLGKEYKGSAQRKNK